MRSGVSRWFVAPALGASIGLAACGNATPRSTEQFCGELVAHSTEIQTLPTEADQIPALITLYSKMGEVAPLDIQTEWEAVYGVLKTANTVNVADPASIQTAADAAYQTQQSAEKVVQWAQTNCGLTLSAVGHVSGGAPLAAATTTSTTAPG